MELLYFSLLAFAATLIGTMAGFGASTIMVPIVSLFLSVPEALLFVGVIHWFGDIWKIVFFKKGFNWRLILSFGIPGIMMAFLAARLPIFLPEELLRRSLGLFLVVYVVFLTFKPDWKMRATTLNGVLGGSLSGFFAGIFGAGGAVRSLFLSAFDLKKSIFLFTSGVIGLLIDSSRIVQYFLSGVRLDKGLSVIVLVCIPVSLVAAYIAKKLVDKVPRRLFRMFVATLLFLIGIRYLIFA